MKIYYFLNNTSRSNFDYIIEKVKLLNNGMNVHEIIEKFYGKVGVFSNECIGDANFLETLSFIEFYKEKFNLNYKETLEKIEFIYDRNFFIYNEEIFVYQEKSFKKINTKSEKVYFVTSRDTFNSPFFIILNYLSELNKNIKIVKYNNRTKEWPYIDKIYYISKIYFLRKKYIGDIIIPLIQDKSIISLKVFFNEVSKLLGNEIILKKNFGDMGLGVRALKLDELFDDRIESIIDKFLPFNHGIFQGIYLTKYINIGKEFRVYYRYDKIKNKVFIYSIKNRINNIGSEIFHKSNFKIYENIPVEWFYFDLSQFSKNKKYLDFIKKICISVNDNCGVIEFFEDDKGKLYFCEINSLGGSLMFPGEDQNNMIKYYIDSLEMIF